MSDRQITVRMPADMAEALSKLAERNDRTISAEIRRMVRKHISSSYDLGPLRRRAKPFRTSQWQRRYTPPSP